MLDKQEFGSRLRIARKAAGYTQMQVQEILGLSQHYLSGIECGNHTVGIVVLYALATLYGCSIDWLCGVEDHGEKVVFFHTLEQLKAMTGLDHRELWEAGFNLDDWDWGFVADRKWENGLGDIMPDYEWWLLMKMENHCVGYEHVEYKGRHYYMQYHS